MNESYSGDTTVSDQGGRSDLQVWPVGKVLLGEYRIDSSLGTGGMGVVFKVSRIDSSRTVYAVKTMLLKYLKTDYACRSMIKEIRTWMELPEHPNIVPCRFFRTIEDRLAIFADYIDGGSLRDWIEEGRFNTLPNILDVAIQIAWGLHAAHEWGIIHQDIKPGNILMTKSGIPMLSDFGLSGLIWSSPSQSAPIQMDADSTISSQGMTLAYCSPEQAIQKRLKRQTDIWSWGLVLLEMLLTRRTWRIGICGPDVVRQIRENRICRGNFTIPDKLLELLDGCFHLEPKDRWKDMQSAADALIEIYRQQTGGEYPVGSPVYEKPITLNRKFEDRRFGLGFQWEDPAVLLNRALRITGVPKNKIRSTLIDRCRTHRAQIVDDIRIFDEAMDVLAKNPCVSRRCKRLLITILYHKGLTQTVSEDLHAASASFVQSGQLIQEMLMVDKAAYWVREYSHVMQNLAVILTRMNKYEEALSGLDVATNLIKDNAGAFRCNEIATAQATIDYSRAVVFHYSGNLSEAVHAYDDAIQKWEMVIKKDSQIDHLKRRAYCYLNKAALLWNLGRYDESVEMNETAIPMLDNLINRRRCRECQPFLGKAYMNTGVAAWSLNRFDMAIKYFDKAIHLFNIMIEKQDRREYSSQLSLILLNRGLLAWSMKEYQQSLVFYDRAMRTLLDLIDRQGRTDLLNDLAGVYSNQAVSLSSMGQHEESLQFYDKALEKRRFLVEEKGYTDLKGDLARTRLNRADVLLHLNRHQEAESEIRDAIPSLKEEISRTGREDLRILLQWVESELLEKLNKTLN